MAASLARALRGVRLLTLDTSAFFAAGDDRDKRRPCALWILEQVQAGRFTCTISAITASELLVRAIEGGLDESLAVQALLQSYPNVRIEPLTLALAARIAAVRAATRLKTPAACVVANALDQGAEALVYGDRGFDRIAARYGSLRVVNLSEHCP